MTNNKHSFLPLEIILTKPKRVSFPLSWVQHIPFSFYLISELKPKIIVELGTHTGNSLCSFAQIIQHLSLDGICYAVDTWEGDSHAGNYEQSVYEDLFNYCTQNYPKQVVLVKKLFDEAVSDFNDNSIDLLHIDGLHTYEAVKNDFETWKNKMSANGIILFHDTQVKHADFGVYNFWAAIKDLYPSFEFRFGHGLGVLFIGNNHLNKSSNIVLDFINSPQNYEIFKLAGLCIDLEKQLQNSQFTKDVTKNRLDLVLNSRSYKYSQKVINYFKTITMVKNLE